MAGAGQRIEGKIAESFGADAERYDRTRPRYPKAMVEAIVAGSPGRDVLDVGCGTGISARQFRAAGCDVLGVDADERMAAFARETGIGVEVGRFEEWAAAGRTFDAVIAGQAWHWVDPVGGTVKAAEVLRPGGRLAPFWNVGEHTPEMSEAFSAVYRRVRPDLPAYRNGMPGIAQYSVVLDRVADGIRQAGGFGEVERWRFDWERTYGRDEWLDQLPTHGDISRFPPDKLARLLAGIGAAIDAVGGSFRMSYAATVVTALRRS